MRRAAMRRFTMKSSGTKTIPMIAMSGAIFGCGAIVTTAAQGGKDGDDDDNDKKKGKSDLMWKLLAEASGTFVLVRCSLPVHFPNKLTIQLSHINRSQGDVV